MVMQLEYRILQIFLEIVHYVDCIQFLVAVSTSPNVSYNVTLIISFPVFPNVIRTSNSFNCCPMIRRRLLEDSIV